MTKQQIIDNLERELRAYKNYCFDLQSRHDYLVDTMAELAQGLGVRAAGCDNSWDIAMKNLAGICLSNVSKMQLRKV